MIKLSPEEFGRRMTAFLENGCKLNTTCPSALKIDRSKPFDPTRFLGRRSTIWRGPADGKGLEGDEDQDPHSVDLTEIDFSKTEFNSFFKVGERIISSRDCPLRIKVDSPIHLDAAFGPALLDEKGQVTLRFLHRIYGIRYLEFATILRNSRGSRCFLYLYQIKNGSWVMEHGIFDYDINRGRIPPLLSNLCAVFRSFIRPLCSLYFASAPPYSGAESFSLNMISH